MRLGTICFNQLDRFEHFLNIRGQVTVTLPCLPRMGLQARRKPDDEPDQRHKRHEQHQPEPWTEEHQYHRTDQRCANRTQWRNNKRLQHIGDGRTILVNPINHVACARVGVVLQRQMFNPPDHDCTQTLIDTLIDPCLVGTADNIRRNQQ